MANQDEQSFVLFEKNDGPYESAFAAERMIAMATAGPGSEDSAAEKKRISRNLRYQKRFDERMPDILVLSRKNLISLTYSSLP